MPDGLAASLNFVAVIRGTDNKYCYANYTVDYKVGGDKGSEAFKLLKSEDGVDKAKVPGLK